MHFIFQYRNRNNTTLTHATKYYFQFYATVEITSYSGNESDLVIPSEIDGYTVSGIGTKAFDSCLSLITVEIPGCIKNIGGCAFYWCIYLTSVKFSEGTESIGDYAFYDCALVSVDLPASIKNIGKCVFLDCLLLKEIKVDGNSQEYCSVDGVLFTKDMTVLIKYPAGNSRQTYAVPTGTKEISNTLLGQNAFGSENLAKKNINENNPNYSSVDGVLLNKEKTEILIYPRNNTYGEYVIPYTVNVIGPYTFYCAAFSSVIIPEGITVIGTNAFAGCSNLTTVTIPVSVTVIEAFAFAFCNNITDSSLQIGINNVIPIFFQNASVVGRRIYSYRIDYTIVISAQ